MASEEPKEPRYVEYIIDDKPTPQPKKKRLTKAEMKERKLQEEKEFKELEAKDRLRRELELSKKTTEKYQDKWENMFNEVKLIQMKDELVEWEKNVNRIFVQKDEKIKQLLDEMATADKMHKQQFSTQMQIIDYLRETFIAFQESAKLLYEVQVSEALQDFYQEVDANNEITNRVKLNCENVMHATNLIVEQEMLSDYQIFKDKREDRVNTEIVKRYRLRDSITNKMNILSNQLKEFLHTLRSTSLDVHKYERVNALTERQCNFVKESQKLNDLEARSSLVHDELQRELAHTETEIKLKINDLKLEHAYFVEMRKKIENDIKQDQERTYEKLKVLTSESFKVIKKYQKLQKYGELLLSLSATCRKLQTESEKVVSLGDSKESNDAEIEDDQFKVQVLDLKAHVDKTESQLLSETKLMKNFWRRQALAEAEIALLGEQKTKLTKENQHYIKIIKRMSKSDNVHELKEALHIQCILSKDTPSN